MTATTLRRGVVLKGRHSYWRRLCTRQAALVRVAVFHVMPDSDELPELRQSLEDSGAVQAALDREAEDFLRLAVRCVRKIQLMGDPWEARRAMAAAILGLQAFSAQLERETTSKQPTHKAFQR